MILPTRRALITGAAASAAFAAIEGRAQTCPPGGAPVHYGTTAPTSLPNVTGVVSPLNWTVQAFDDFTGWTPSNTAATATTPAGNVWQTLVLPGTPHNNGSLSQEYACSPGFNGINPYSQSGSILTITGSVPTSGQLGSLGGYQYISGSFNSSPFLSFAWGLVEFNVRLGVAANGNNSGMWGIVWTSTISPNGWPPEVDVGEQQGSSGTSWDNYIHYETNGAGADGSVQSNPAILTGFHTYAALITPNYVASYFDGALVRTASPAVLNSATHYLNNNSDLVAIVSLFLGDGNGGGTVTNAQLPATMQIDWFRFSALGPE
jgi:beta-glucanase (GH16 family)